MARVNRSLLCLTVILLTVFAVSARASVLTINITTEIFQMDLQGTGLIPLASDSGNLLGDSVDGFGWVDANVRVTESANSTSIATTSVVINSEDLDINGMVTAGVSGNFILFLDLEFTDADDRPGRDFATPDPLVLAAATPLTMTATTTVLLDLSDLNNIDTTDSGTLTSSSQVVHNLGMDINNNGIDDVLKYTADDFVLDINDVSFAAITFDPVDFFEFISGSSDLTIDVQGQLSATATMAFSGSVADATTDPPFTLGLTGPVNPPTLSVPEPATWILISLGLAGLGYARWRGLKA